MCITVREKLVGTSEGAGDGSIQEHVLEYPTLGRSANILLAGEEGWG